jgi:osmoprotectant transport system ATP-binding protein
MSGPPQPAIEFRDVSYRVDGGGLLLDAISLRFESGTTTALLGRSGAGKTTLLRLVNQLLPTSGGELLVEGKDAHVWNPVFLRRRVGYAIQETGLFPHFTIARNIALALELEGKNAGERRARALEMLKMVGLDAKYADRYPHELSGGQRQRAGVARALAASPSILLLDEPFGALDPLTRRELQEMTRTLLRQLRTTTLLVTHDLEEALYIADRIILLDSGRVVADWPSAEFRDSPQPEVREYVRAFRHAEGLQ